MGIVVGMAPARAHVLVRHRKHDPNSLTSCVSNPQVVVRAQLQDSSKDRLEAFFALYAPICVRDNDLRRLAGFLARGPHFDNVSPAFEHAFAVKQTFTVVRARAAYGGVAPRTERPGQHPIPRSCDELV